MRHYKDTKISKIPNHWENILFTLEIIAANVHNACVCCNGGLSANLKPFLTLMHRADNQVWCSISPTEPCARTLGCKKT